MKNHKATIIMGVFCLFVTAYVHGYRIADLSELPNSQRPHGIVVQGQ